MSESDSKPNEAVKAEESKKTKPENKEETPKTTNENPVEEKKSLQERRVEYNRRYYEKKRKKNPAETTKVLKASEAEPQRASKKSKFDFGKWLMPIALVAAVVVALIVVMKGRKSPDPSIVPSAPSEPAPVIENKTEEKFSTPDFLPTYQEA